MAIPPADSASYPQNRRSSDDEFVRLFVQHQRVLFVFLRTVLNDPVDAEEVLQETSMILWHKRQQFTAGTSFLNWSMTVAQFEALKFRRRRKHNPQALDEELMEQLAADMSAQGELVEARHRALGQCLEALSERERNLVNAAYAIKASKKSIGQGFGMTPNGFYKSLNRIRQRLLKCIQHRLMVEDGA